MSRLRRFWNNVASGQVLLAANVLFTLASVPLALSYLNPAQFALWSALVQISGYLMLVDVGVSGALSRLLVDAKDDVESGEYLLLLRTGFLTQVVQGGLIAVVGMVVAPFLADLLNIAGESRDEFVSLVRWQSGIVGASFLTRIFSMVLRAHQRVDLVNYAQVAAFAANFLTLWLGLRYGTGPYAVILANLAAWLVMAGAGILACRQLGFAKAWQMIGKCSWTKLRAMFRLGAKMFFVAVGAQVILFSQMLIITRSIGLEAFGVWAVASKAFTLLCQIIWRVYDMSEPAFAEMMARGEQARLRERYQTLFTIVVLAAASGALGLAAGNGSFVELWTRGALGWAPLNDLLLAVWLVLLTVVHCHNCLLVQTKRLGWMPVIYFLEAGYVLGAGLWAAKHAGFTGLLWISLLGSICFSGAYGVLRISRYFELTLAVILEWLVPAAKFLLFGGVVMATVWWVLQAQPPLVRLLGSIGVWAITTLLVTRIALSQTMRDEMLRAAPARMSGLVRRVLNAK